MPYTSHHGTASKLLLCERALDEGPTRATGLALPPAYLHVIDQGLPMTRLDVGIGQCVTSCNPDDYIITVGLGSCVAIVAYDLELAVGGMIHIRLPLSTIDADRAQLMPGMYVDTGLPVLLDAMHAHGCRKSNLAVKVAGGAAMYDDGGHFAVGKRNVSETNRLLWKAGLFIAAEDVGGTQARTVLLYVGDGRCILRMQREEYLL